MKISVIIISYNRKNELRDCLLSLLNQSSLFEIIVVDNNSSDGSEEIFSGGEVSHPAIKFFKLKENVGVAGGRNYGITQATGDVLFFIDDDALLEPQNAIELIVKKFEKDKDVGILAFKIVNYYSKKIQREEFPHIDKFLDPDKEFETTYFIGAGHAIRKEVFEKCGLYPDDFFYGMEELDLSFRVLDNGFRIIYFPEITVWHKKSLKGRITDEKKWIYTLRNRMAISYKYLPYKDFLISCFVWLIKIAIKSRSLSVPMKGLNEFLKYKNSLKRTPIRNETLDKIKKLRGRIWH